MPRLQVPRYLLALPIAVAIVGAAVFFNGTRAPKYITAEVRRGDIVQEVLASGNVASPKNIDLQFQNTGKLSALSVETGNRVAKGEVLARLDTAVLEAQRLQAASTLAAQQAQLSTLREGTRPEQIDITRAQLESDKTALAQSEQTVIDAIKNAYSVSDSVVRNTVDQFIDNPQSSPHLSFLVSSQSIQSTVETSRANVGLMLAMWLSGTASLSVQGDLSGAEQLAQKNLQMVATLLSDSTAALSSAISGPQSTSAELAAWMSAVATARASVNTAVSTLTAATTARKNAASTLDRDEKKLALELAGSTASAVAGQQAQVDAASANLAAIDAQLGQMRLTAPVSGVITKVNNEPGETILPGTVVISMIPEAQLRIDVNLSEDNVANAQTGDPARITIDAFGGTTEWQGIVTKIDPAQTVIGGAVYYKTTVNFDRPDDRVKPGMTTNIWIQTGLASSTLMVPASALQTNDAGTYVQVLENGSVHDQKITTGLKSRDGKIEVTSGLTEGQQVVTGQ